jgi:peptidoglycan/xylan/chitin deacetylase (PgdA/CDA1 family)
VCEFSRNRVRDVSRKATFRKALTRLSSPVLGPVLSGRSLAVLCYHRVVERVEHGLFPELNSAHPEVFRQQLDMLGIDHEFVSEGDVIAWLEGKRSLPARPVLLTFDDGYRDNYETVFPILVERGIPATFFLATGHMDTGEPPWWDRASALIAASSQEVADLPLLGTRELDTLPRHQLAGEWIEAAKLVLDGERRVAVDALPEAVGISSLDWPEVSMKWGQVREMAANGMSLGGHTHNHPILSRMDVPHAREEIRRGLDRMREELGIDVVSFAYPNGGRDDFNDKTERTVAELGISVAFSLASGPALRAEVKRAPLAIRRIYVGEGDTADSLQLKLLGAGRVADLVRRP